MKRMGMAAFAAAGFATAALAPTVAAAAQAFATATVNERAGPGTEYPVISVIPAGAPVTIYGCLNDWDWCDVDYYGYRGWVFGGYLQAYYQQQPVALAYYGPQLGIPFVAFNYGYWDTYYRDRPWYRDYGRYPIPGRPGYYDPKPGGAYVYYPPAGRDRPPPRRVYDPPPKRGYADLPKPGRKAPAKQAFAPQAPNTYVYDPPGTQGPHRKKCPMKNGKPVCKPPPRD